jgi:hypothetical protein
MHIFISSAVGIHQENSEAADYSFNASVDNSLVHKMDSTRIVRVKICW